MGPDDAYAAAAAPQQSQTQVSTLLRLLLKQQLRKLQKKERNQLTMTEETRAGWRNGLRSISVQTHLWYQCPLCGKAVLEVEGALVAGHAVEQHLQNAAKDALLGLGNWDRLQKDIFIGIDYKVQQCIFLFCINPSSLTCTIISKVSKIIRLASVARFPSISASCSSSALVLQWKWKNIWVFFFKQSFIYSLSSAECLEAWR